MKQFLKCAAALALATLLALSAAADAPMLIAANPLVKDDAAAEQVEFVQAKYPTTSGCEKLTIEAITNIKPGKEAEADTVVDIANMVDENAASSATVTVKDGVATLYFQVGALCNPRRLLVSGIEDDYILTLSASPNSQYWYDVRVKELVNKDGSRVYEVTTKRDYQYFQVDIITAAETLTVDTLALVGKMDKPVLVEVTAPVVPEQTPAVEADNAVKPSTDAAADTAADKVVKEAPAAETKPAEAVKPAETKPAAEAKPDAAVDTAETAGADAAVEAIETAEEPVVEEKLTTSYTKSIALSGAVR